MDSIKRQPPRNPRIVVLISHLHLVAAPSRLAREVHEVLPAFAGLADVRVVDTAIADALPRATAMQQTDEVDVFICPGATGAYLRKRLSVPVILMPVSDCDILHTLERARRITDQVAILSYEDTAHQLDDLRPLLAVSLRQLTYTSLQEAADAVRQLSAEGCRAIIGSSMVTELAEEAGLAGVLAVSANAIRQALENAMEFIRTARAEAVKRQHLDALLQHLTDGVIAVDMEGRIESINPAMAHMLEVPSEHALRRSLQELDPQLEIAQVLSTGAAEEGRIVRLRSRTVLLNAIPILEEGMQTGVVITCQDTNAVQRADRRIRSGTRPTRFIAKYRLAQIIGDSPSMRALVDLAQRYAQTDSTVLINGESGTGKELLAQGIHNASRRRSSPFVAINCASFPETLLESELFGYEEGAFSGSRRGGKPGLFELAHTGTIFLDEIGDMPLSLQTRLLRVLQEREVVRLGGTELIPIDVRIIAATHCNLRNCIAEGRFREDLYYRLNILRLKLPPLRERREDIDMLARHILRDVASRTGLEAPDSGVLNSLLPYLESYSWPGNIRELENILERMVLLLAAQYEPGGKDRFVPGNLIANMFDDEDWLPHDSGDNEPNLKSLARKTELVRIRRVLEECGGSLEQASKRLGISRSTIWRRLNAGPDLQRSVPAL